MGLRNSNPCQNHMELWGCPKKYKLRIIFCGNIFQWSAQRRINYSALNVSTVQPWNFISLNPIYESIRVEWHSVPQQSRIIQQLKHIQGRTRKGSDKNILIKNLLFTTLAACVLKKAIVKLAFSIWRGLNWIADYTKRFQSFCWNDEAISPLNKVLGIGKLIRLSHEK